MSLSIWNVNIETYDRISWTGRVNGDWWLWLCAQWTSWIIIIWHSCGIISEFTKTALDFFSHSDDVKCLLYEMSKENKIEVMFNCHFAWAIIRIRSIWSSRFYWPACMYWHQIQRIQLTLSVYFWHFHLRLYIEYSTVHVIHKQRVGANAESENMNKAKIRSRACLCAYVCFGSCSKRAWAILFVYICKRACMRPVHLESVKFLVHNQTVRTDGGSSVYATFRIKGCHENRFLPTSGENYPSASDLGKFIREFG